MGKHERHLSAFAFLRAAVEAPNGSLARAFQKPFVVVKFLTPPRRLNAAEQGLIALGVDFMDLKLLQEPVHPGGSVSPFLQAVARWRSRDTLQRHLPKGAAQIV